MSGDERVRARFLKQLEDTLAKKKQRAQQTESLITYGFLRPANRRVLRVQDEAIYGRISAFMPEFLGSWLDKHHGVTREEMCDEIAGIAKMLGIEEDEAAIRAQYLPVFSTSFKFITSHSAPSGLYMPGQVLSLVEDLERETNAHYRVRCVGVRYSGSVLHDELLSIEEGWASLQAKKEGKRGLICTEGFQGETISGSVENSEITDALLSLPWKLEDVLRVPKRKKVSGKDLPYVREE